MAQVPTIQTWREAEPYLENLKDTVQADVRPLLDTPGAAPFAISREVLSYIDHLGHLYSGKGQVGERSKDYLKYVMSRIDQNYHKRAGEIYQMYRCGPVHEFEPKVLENKKGQLLQWLCYKGGRTDLIEFVGQQVRVTHLEPVSMTGSKHFWLPVSTPCLIEDLTASINGFLQAGPEDERVTAWNCAARELASPEPFDFVIP
jgi:hypothetical protein